jgi:hypothetical protein
MRGAALRILVLAVALAVGGCAQAPRRRLTNERLDVGTPRVFELSPPFHATGKRTAVCVLHKLPFGLPAGFPVRAPDGRPMTLKATLASGGGESVTFDRLFDESLDGRWALCVREQPSVPGRTYSRVVLEGIDGVEFDGAWILSE